MVGVRLCALGGSLGLLGLLAGGCIFSPEDPPEDPTFGSSTGTTSTADTTSTTDPPMDSGTMTPDPTSTVTTNEPDGTSTDGPDVDTSAMTMGMPLVATIYEIQDGTIAEGELVDVEEIIVTAVTSNGCYVQEFGGGMYSGILVVAGGPCSAVGNETNIVGGLVTEVMGQTVIDLSVGLFQSTGLRGVQLPAEVLPLADLADDVAEPWEGVLVQVEGAPLQVTDLPPMGFTVTEGEDSVSVGSFIYDAAADAMSFPDFGVNASFTSVRGPLSEGPGGYRIQPRADFDLTGYESPLVAETHPFPTVADDSMVASPPSPWNEGDYFEGVRMTMLPQLSSVDIHVDIVTNGLSACGFQNAEVILNGVVVGDFTVAQGTVAIDQSYPVPMGVVGPAYTVRYETTATVQGGCGAAGYDLNTSTITFNP